MTDLDIIDAEIVPTSTDLDASMRRVEASVSSIADELVWQLTSEAWRADGRYSSFSDLWADRWEPLGISVPRTVRPLAVEQMRRERLTQQQIADKLNVGQSTVDRDLRRLNTQMGNGSLPETITDSRGQERPATYRKPEPPRTVNTDTGEIVPSAAERQAAHDAIAREANAIENVAHMTDTLRRLSALRTPEYRARLIENNAAHPDHEDPAYTQHFNPQGIRDLADLLNTLATEMENAS